jgi:hypothetical protein
MPITRMEISYKSRNKCNIKPKIFTTGGYSVRLPNGTMYSFDFEDMEASFRFEKDGHMYIDCLQKHQDYSVYEDDESDDILTIVANECKKEDFTDVFYESFIDDVDGDVIELVPICMTFYDFSTTGSGMPMVLAGDKFSNLIIAGGSYGN